MVEVIYVWSLPHNKRISKQGSMFDKEQRQRNAPRGLSAIRLKKPMARIRHIQVQVHCRRVKIVDCLLDNHYIRAHGSF